MSCLGNKAVFAQNLKYYMDLNKIDRNQLCVALGFKYTTVSEWLAGNKYPRIDKIEMLANYFGIQKSNLIEEKDKNADITKWNDTLKFALWEGDSDIVDEEMIEDVKDFAKLLAEKKKRKLERK